MYFWLDESPLVLCNSCCDSNWLVNCNSAVFGGICQNEFKILIETNFAPKLALGPVNTIQDSLRTLTKTIADRPAIKTRTTFPVHLFVLFRLTRYATLWKVTCHVIAFIKISAARVNLGSSTRTRHFRTGQKKYIRHVLKCLDSMLLRHIYEFDVCQISFCASENGSCLNCSDAKVLCRYDSHPV